jgi:hypothetical protein
MNLTAEKHAPEGLLAQLGLSQSQWKAMGIAQRKALLNRMMGNTLMPTRSASRNRIRSRSMSRVRNTHGNVLVPGAPGGPHGSKLLHNGTRRRSASRNRSRSRNRR